MASDAARARYRKSAKGKAAAARYREKHREAIKARAQAKASTPEGRAKARNAHLVATYGITSAQYDIILASQGGGCAICHRQRRPGEGYFPVEHCHKTGQIRGITCTYCNRTRLGRGREDPIIVHRIEDYLLHGAERVALTLKTASDWGQS